MAIQRPHREAPVSAPADRQSFSPAVPPHGSDKAADLSPWPVADTPGRPFIHQIQHDESVRDWAYSAAIWTAVILMGVAILFTVFDRFLDGKF